MAPRCLAKGWVTARVPWEQILGEDGGCGSLQKLLHLHVQHVDEESSGSVKSAATVPTHQVPAFCH